MDSDFGYNSKLMKWNVKETSDESETAAQQFSAAIDFMNSIAYIAGIELKSDWRFNGRAKGVLLLNCTLFWTELYTFALLFPSLNCVELLAGFMFTVTCYSKFSYFVFHHKRFMSFVDFIYKVVNNSTEARRQTILLNTVKTIFYHFKIVIGGYSIGVALYMLYPFYDYFVNRNLTPVSPLIFPFVDNTTGRGFLISTILNLIAPAWNVTGAISVGCIFMTFVDVYAALVSLIADDFHIFDGMWKEHQYVDLRKPFFRNILLELMDLARYSFVMNNLFNLVATIQIGCCFFGITGSLFGYMVNDFYGGIGGSLYFTAELMLFCYIGQIMDNQTDRITLAIFHSNWYMYENKYQKDLLFAFCIIQNMKPITIADVMPLNVCTGLKIIQKVYSIIMFMLEALN